MSQFHQFMVQKRLKTNSALLPLLKICFLARQGVAHRGDGDESNSNFEQLLHLRAIDQPQLTTWLEQKTDKYTSLQIQNELLTVMATAVLRKIG